MTDKLDILSQNAPFLMDSFNLGPMIGVFMALSLVDAALKGWALWRAARMGKIYWYIPLLLVNSIGIFPAIFLLMTNSEYKKKKVVGTTSVL